MRIRWEGHDVGRKLKKNCFGAGTHSVPNGLAFGVGIFPHAGHLRPRKSSFKVSWMTARLKILSLHALLVFGIACACSFWALSEKSETLMGMLR